MIRASGRSSTGHPATGRAKLRPLLRQAAWAVKDTASGWPTVAASVPESKSHWPVTVVPEPAADIDAERPLSSATPRRLSRCNRVAPGWSESCGSGSDSM